MNDELQRQQANTDYLMDGEHEGNAIKGAVNAILIVAVLVLALWGVL